MSDSETNHDIVKVGLISAGLVSAFMVHRLFFSKRSNINMATSIIRMIAGGLILKYGRYTVSMIRKRTILVKKLNKLLFNCLIRT